MESVDIGPIGPVELNTTCRFNPCLQCPKEQPRRPGETGDDAWAMTQGHHRSTKLGRISGTGGLCCHKARLDASMMVNVQADALMSQKTGKGVLTP